MAYSHKASKMSLHGFYVHTRTHYCLYISYPNSNWIKKSHNQTRHAKPGSQTFLTHPHVNYHNLVSEKHNRIWMSQTTPTGLIFKWTIAYPDFFLIYFTHFCWLQMFIQSWIDPLHITVYNKWKESMLLNEGRTSVLFINFTSKL